ncbi:MAG: hypothetical protein ACM3ML_10485 [Micromonosporaceae bacterium]
MSGLHCGNRYRDNHDVRFALVIPLTTSGLHCGYSSAICPQIASSGHPALRERAPLRPE